MANTFTNAKSAAIGTAPVTVYTTPAGTTAVIHGLFITNITASSVLVTVMLDAYNVLKDVEIRANSTLVVNKPVNLLATEDLIVVSNTASSVDVVVSVLEVS